MKTKDFKKFIYTYKVSIRLCEPAQHVQARLILEIRTLGGFGLGLHCILLSQMKPRSQNMYELRPN